MAEATKLFDKSGGAASGSKQDAVNGAAMTVMKLFVQSKFSSAVGGSDSGGLSSMMGLVSSFLCVVHTDELITVMLGFEIYVVRRTVIYTNLNG